MDLRLNGLPSSIAARVEAMAAKWYLTDEKIAICGLVDGCEDREMEPDSVHVGDFVELQLNIVVEHGKREGFGRRSRMMNLRLKKLTVLQRGGYNMATD